MSTNHVWIEFHGLCVHDLRFIISLLVPFEPVFSASQPILESLKAGRMGGRHAVAFTNLNLFLDRRGHGARNFILNFENVFEFTVVDLRPNMIAGLMRRSTAQ